MTEKQFWQSIEQAVGTQLGRSEEYKEKFFKRLSALLIRESEYLRDTSNDKRLAELKKLFVKAGYNKYWSLVQDAFDKLLAYQNKHWQENTTANTTLGRSNVRLAAFEKVEFERFGKLGMGAVEALNERFAEAKKSNWTTAEFSEQIKGISGKVTAYSQGIANTAMRGWDRAVTASKAEIADVDSATFDGPPPIETSHDFCIENYQQEFTREEIDTLSNGQLDPPIIYGGGYNCRHRFRWNIRKILK